MRGVKWTGLAAVLLAISTCVAASPARGVVLVVGSINVDVIVPVARLPWRGETATALNASALLAVGGKGANQAVAVARLQLLGQPPPVFVGRLGGDAHEPWLRKSLQDAGVDLSATETTLETSCGQGLVLLDADGAATSVVLGGANTQGWPANDVALEELADRVLSAHRVSVLLLQREVPQRVNTAFAVRAAARHIPVCLDAGGEAGPLAPELAAAVTYLTPNESELARLTGMPTETEEQVIAAARALRREGAGVNHIMVTLGERGSLLLFANDTLLLQPAAPLPGGQLIDATAAGDAFRAAFAIALTEQLPLTSALALASAAGAIAASRLGAMPSLPTRAEVDAHVATAPAAHSATLPPLAGRCEPPAAAVDGYDDCHLQFASRLNSMAARWDLVDGNAGLTNDVPGWIARQATVSGLSTVALNYPQHFDDTATVVAALRASGLRLDALCLRFPPTFRAGALTNPNATLRAAALDLAVRACTTAVALKASHVVYWSPYDGYDIHLAANYTAVWASLVAAFQAMADACAASHVRVSFEWKPTDSNSRFSFVPSTASALALVTAVGRPTFGLTLDTGHLLLAGENPGQSIAAVAQAGALFGIQLSDAHVRLGAEDGLPFGSVSAASALEVVYWLRRSGYSGHIYFDTFPLNSDPVREAAFNIRTFKTLWRRAAQLQRAGLESLMDRQDGMGVLELLEEDAAS